MGGVTRLGRTTRATTQPPRLPRMTRHNGVPRVGSLAGLIGMDRLNRLVVMERMTGMDIPEVLYTLTVSDRHAWPTAMVIPTRRNRLIGS